MPARKAYRASVSNPNGAVAEGDCVEDPAGVPVLEPESVPEAVTVVDAEAVLRDKNSSSNQEAT